MALANFDSRTLWTRDNLDVLRGLNSETVDLIYLDPPFNSNKDYAAPVGSQAAGAAFKDTWHLSDLDKAWTGLVADEEPAVAHLIQAAGRTHSPGMQSYLTMMAVRLLEMRRVLKPTGSVYLHCDPTADAYLRALMDAVFGRDQFRNEIVWAYTGPANTRRWFPRKHDVILFYARGDNDFYRDAVRVPYKAGSFTMGGSGSLARKNKPGTDHKSGRDEALARGKVIEDWWTDIPALSVSRERVGYPTQKPLALLERIIAASSAEGDTVLDPFCGCATACVAADKLGRRWVGIDISERAADLVRERLSDLYNRPFTPYEIAHRTDVPQRTDVDAPKNYRQNKHVLFGEQEGRCNGCRTAFEFRHMTVDHIIPQKRGGTDHVENLQLLCGHCNSVKGDRDMAYLMSRLAEIGGGVSACCTIVPITVTTLGVTASATRSDTCSATVSFMTACASRCSSMRWLIASRRRWRSRAMMNHSPTMRAYTASPAAISAGCTPSACAANGPAPANAITPTPAANSMARSTTSAPTTAAIHLRIGAFCPVGYGASTG